MVCQIKNLNSELSFRRKNNFGKKGTFLIIEQINDEQLTLLP